jgi:hypothetical protein
MFILLCVTLEDILNWAQQSLERFLFEIDQVAGCLRTEYIYIYLSYDGSLTRSSVDEGEFPEVGSSFVVVYLFILSIY